MHINIFIRNDVKKALDNIASLLASLSGVKLTYADLIRGMINQATGFEDNSPSAAWARSYIDTTNPYLLTFPQTVDIDINKLEIKGDKPGNCTIKLDGKEVRCKSLQLTGDSQSQWALRMEIILESANVENGN